MAVTHPPPPGRLWTVAEALRELPPDAHWEIDEGRLVMREPAAPCHGDASVEIAAQLHAFVKQYRLGRVFGADTGFHLAHGPDALRAPDIAFVGNERLRAITDPERFAAVAPDLAVEVLSPSDRPGEVRRKVGQYLALGVRSVWVVDARRRRLQQRLAGGDVRVYASGAEMVEDPTLPGFRCALGDLLPEPWGEA